MNYCIFSIDDSRKHYTDQIRSVLQDDFYFEESGVKTVDGRKPSELKMFSEIHPYRVNWVNDSGPLVGHLGIWYSVLNAISIDSDHLVTFEDDAVLHPAFSDIFWMVTSKLPRDTDAFSLFLPRDQDHVFEARMRRGTSICTAYQRYGGVSMMWTPQGMRKFEKLVERDGIVDQWDNQLYSYARSGEMNVYTQPPTTPILVGITGYERSIVQESEPA